VCKSLIEPHPVLRRTPRGRERLLKSQKNPRRKLGKS
jgi:hypothetical protein